MQIDIMRIENRTAVCNLYTGDRCVRIIMTQEDYEALVRDGFFIRDGKSIDSAGTINTTADYHKIRYVEGHRELVPM